MSLTLWVVLALQHLAAGLLSPSLMPRVEREAWLMGTRFHVVIEGVDRATADRLGESMLREVERIDALLNTWDPSTPLGRLNQAPPSSWTDVDGELAALLRESSGWADATSGAFDTRIGALIDAWDLRGSGRSPQAGELAAALAASGPNAVELGERGLMRSSGAAWMDSGGFGKGAALRAARRLMDESPVPSEARVLLDLGGQVLAFAPFASPWIVDVAHPLRRFESAATLSVHDGSASTSGSSERGRHILDPRSGLPVDPWGSVTVVDADAYTADALSTALYVMGPRTGIAWAEQAGVAALFLELDGETVRPAWTSAMEPWLLEPPASPQPDKER
ncbi:MAG: FAD:protein FMN transferase [Gemmatimonadota bacterium]|nr:FAD:protein FMN transferase [Gemmatimonadota bacterium]